MGRLQGLTASKPVSLPRAFGEWCEAFPFIKGKCSKEVYPVDYGQKSEKVASLQQRSCRSLPLRKPASPQAVSFAFCVPLQGKACGFESQPPGPFQGRTARLIRITVKTVSAMGFAHYSRDRKIAPAAPERFPRHSVPLRCLHIRGVQIKRKTAHSATWRLRCAPFLSRSKSQTRRAVSLRLASNPRC